MKVIRTALLLSLGFGLLAPFTRAETPAPAKPPEPVSPPAVKAAPKMEDPTVPAIKGKAGPENGFLKRHEAFLKDKTEILAKGPIQFLLVGDSITDGWRGKNGKETYDKAFGAYNPYNIGISGDRTQHVLWRLDNGEVEAIKPKVAMLMIGTNNLGNALDEQIAAGITQCVEDLRSKLPNTKVLLLAVFPRSAKATDPFRARLKNINETIKKLDDGGKTVKFLDIGDKFLDAEGNLPKDIMPDSLHPNAKGYAIWAEAVKPTLDEMMK